MLTQAWQETLPRETLSFDVLQLPRQPAQLLILDEVRIQFRRWEGGGWRTLRTATHLMQRDLYALHPAHEGKTLIYTDGGGWIYTDKEIISDEPTRTVPIGRLVDKEGVARAVCFDHHEQAPYYYVLEKPLEEDEFFIEPEEVYAGKILQSIVMSLPRLAQSFRNFYASGYRWLCRYRWSAKEPARVYGVAPDRLALLELRPNRRPYNAWQLSFRSLGAPRRENALVVRTGDPKNEGRTMLLVMRATNTQVQLSAYSV